MGWANELYNVYNTALKLSSEENKTLLPVSHSTANAQIEVTIDGNGNFKRASEVFDNRKNPNEANTENKPLEEESSPVTIIPVTEDSGSRGSGIAPHPFADKLVYIAGDYIDFCDSEKNDDQKYQAYIKQLMDWNNSEYSHPSVKALYIYLAKGSLIADIVKTGLFKTDAKGRLTNDKVQKTEQKDCFVRFIVNGQSSERRTWLDKSLHESFKNYLISKQTNRGFCYATAEKTAMTYKHPSKILNTGDKGKLFSANDETGFTYKGRFFEKEQAFAIGYQFSQKMHNGLKWLIETRGFYVGGMQIIVWNSTLTDVVNVMADSEELISKKEEEDQDADYVDFDFPDFNFDSEIAFANYKNALHKAIFGEKVSFDNNQKTMVMILDEAVTGKGRVSVNMYRELLESEFYKSVEKWHTDTAWNRFNPVAKKFFTGSYPLLRLADYAFGTEQNGKLRCPDELKKETVTRLLPCVVEGRRLPKDILTNLVSRASKPLAFSSKGNWLNIINAACGMIRKTMIEKGEKCTMAVDEICPDRNYLFGRLLAVAEEMELATYSSEDKKSRVPNARRYWERFSHSPVSTWSVIYERLIPYANKLGNYNIFSKEIDYIEGKMSVKDFSDNGRLEPLYLLGYSHQKGKPYNEYGKNNQKADGSNENNNNNEEE